MKLFLYGVKDEVVGEFIFFFPAQNDGVMLRMIKGSLLNKEPNQINTDIKDKAVYSLGSIDTATGIIEASSPLYVKRVAEVRIDLINEIKVAKLEAGEEKPEAPEVVPEDGADKGLKFPQQGA